MKLRIVGLLLVASLISTASVRADPVIVRSGSLSYDSDFGGFLAILYLNGEPYFNLY